MIADGFVVIDKPPGVTSHDIVAVVRAVTGLKKVGHTGTLDPFATGVLPLALGGATRLISYLDESEKIYDAFVRLGTQTDTGDPTGQTIAEAPVRAYKPREVDAVLQSFVGERQQTPPKYSAVKVQGKPLYAYARAGEEVEARARPIRIYGMEMLEVTEDTIRVRIRCSRGTYARVLAEQIAEQLGTVGHLGELRREGSGLFKLDAAVSMSRLATIVGGSPDWINVLRATRREDRVPWRDRASIIEGLAPFAISPATALAHLPRVTLSPLDARRFIQTGVAPASCRGGDVAVVCFEGTTVVGVVPPGGQKAVVLAREDAPPSRS